MTEEFHLWSHMFACFDVTFTAPWVLLDDGLHEDNNTQTHDRRGAS